MADEHKMQVYNEQLGCHDAKITKVAVDNAELDKEKDLLNKDIADLASKIQEVELARDVTITKKVAR